MGRVRAEVVAAVVIAAAVALFLALSSGLVPPPARTVTRCSVVKRVVVLRRVELSSVAWLEVPGVNITRVCSTYRLIPAHRVCLVENGVSKCLWRYRKVLTGKAVTHHVRPLTRLIVKVNLTAYRELWLKENPGGCAHAVCYLRHCRCLRYLKYLNVTFRTYWIHRHLISHGRYVDLEIQVPVPTHVLVNDSKHPEMSPYYEKLPTTYIKHVLTPLIKYLSKNKKEEALNIKYLIQQSGWNSNTEPIPEDFWVHGGICGEWASVAEEMAYLFHLPALAIDAADHSFAVLCNVSWWRNQYALRLYLKNGTVLACYVWVDTGYAIKNWGSRYIIVWKVESFHGRIVPVRNAVKLVNGRWVRAYGYG